jgi:hypothetical protein
MAQFRYIEEQRGYGYYNYSFVLFRGTTQTQLKNAVHGFRIVGGFSLCLAGRFFAL